MSDVFLSYASGDRQRVAPLAGALTERGWDVWWDRSIPAGKTFDEVIEAELADTRSVVVVWTEESAGSRWVRTEAAEGLDSGILVPVLLDAVAIPLAFRRIQAADLTDWKPGPPHAGFDELITAVNALLGRGAAAITEEVGVDAAGVAPEEPVPPMVEPVAERSDTSAIDRTQLGRSRLDHRYVRAEEAIAAEEWTIAISRLEDIASLDPSYPGAGAMLDDVKGASG